VRVTLSAVWNVGPAKDEKAPASNRTFVIIAEEDKRVPKNGTFVKEQASSNQQPSVTDTFHGDEPLETRAELPRLGNPFKSPSFCRIPFQHPFGNQLPSHDRNASTSIIMVIGSWSRAHGEGYTSMKTTNGHRKEQGKRVQTTASMGPSMVMGTL
jgi:hypothetical protein